MISTIVFIYILHAINAPIWVSALVWARLGWWIIKLVIDVRKDL